MQRALVNGLAKFVDQQFFDPAVAAVAGQNPASITNGLVAVTGGTTVAEKVAALVAAFYAALPQALINRRVAHVADIFRHQMRAQFPVSEMRENQDDGPAGAEPFVDSIEVANLNMTLDLVDRHGAHLEAAQQVCAE